MGKGYLVGAGRGVGNFAKYECTKNGVIWSSDIAGFRFKSRSFYIGITKFCVVG